MSLIVTPSQLQKKAEFYHQLGTLCSAGLPILQAIEATGRSASGKRDAALVRSLLTLIQSGSTFTEAISKSEKELPTFDLSLIQAGEKSGRMDECLKLLAGYYDENARLLRGMISELTYPLFVVHFACFIGPIQKLILKGDVMGYLRSALTPILPMYALVLFISWASQGTRSERCRMWVERFLGSVPILGSGRKSLFFSRPPVCSS